MNKLKTIKTSLFLGVLLMQTMFPFAAKAVKTEILPNDKEKVLTIMESPTGKLFHLTKGDKRPNKLVPTVLTAYSSTPDQTDDSPFIAASGKRVYDGMVAANWLPMGTKIKIPSLYGEKIFTVDDRMNARYGYGRMDIWMDAPRAQVKKFGVKRATVEVYLVEKSVKVAKVGRI